MLLWVISEVCDVSYEAVVRVIGVDGHYVVVARLLNSRKTQKWDVFSRVTSTVT